MKTKILYIIVLLTYVGITLAAGNEKYKKFYLNDPKTPKNIKHAIVEGKVIKGMCPFQAFAAAGMPGPYMVRKDPEKWGPGVPPPKIIQAQCKFPDNSIVELKFRNASQFKSKEPVTFRVRFEKGKAVLIDKGDFSK